MFFSDTPRKTNISLPNALLKMICLFLIAKCLETNMAPQKKTPGKGDS